jgi:hypothetical protein
MSGHRSWRGMSTPVCAPHAPRERLLTFMAVDARDDVRQGREMSVSNRPVGPPVWARVDTDTVETARSVQGVTEFRRSSAPQCRCGAGPDQAAPVRVIHCTLYDVRLAKRCTIEVQRCAVCPADTRRDAGPDLGEYGVFNYNNTRLYTHDLLNEYTSQFTASETTFNAFCKTISRAYASSCSAVGFVSDDDFRNVWFSFTRIQQLADSFECDVCGPDPESVLADGVTVAFDAKHVLSSLAPPTRVTADSVERDTVQRVTDLMLVPHASLRKDALAVLHWRQALKGPSSQLDDDDDFAIGGDEQGMTGRAATLADPPRDEAREARRQAKLSKRDAHDKSMRDAAFTVARSLGRVNSSLAALFLHHVSSQWDTRVEPSRGIYFELLRQASTLSAEPPAVLTNSYYPPAVGT